MTAVAEVLPVGHAYPAVQFPLHPAAGSPDDAPYRPAAHTLHDPDPLKLYHPAPHTIAVAEVLPAGHAYPAVQFPEHDAVDSPTVAPKVPAGHDPVHCDEISPVEDPKVPAGQGLHVQAPPVLYVPALHIAGVAVIDPATQKWPALQLPEQVGAAMAGVAP